MPPPRITYTLDDVLEPASRDALRHLELFARNVVEGLLHGGHRSRRKGVSTEFDHHTNYQPGDPLKHIDWKVSARHDEYFVKRYIEDTSLSVYLAVDRSGSMQQETGGVPKYLQAARIAAGMAYMILRQRDSVGLVTAAADELFWLPVRSADTHLVQILRALAMKAPSSGDGLDLCLKMILDRVERRGLIVVISDLMFDPDPIQRRMANLQARGHEIMLCQLSDPAEASFPFNRWARFISREDPSVRYRLDPVPLKKIYVEEYRLLMEEWATWCRKRDVHRVTLGTDEHAEVVLSEYLFKRMEIAGKR